MGLPAMAHEWSSTRSGQHTQAGATHTHKRSGQHTHTSHSKPNSWNCHQLVNLMDGGHNGRVGAAELHRLGHRDEAAALGKCIACGTPKDYQIA